MDTELDYININRQSWNKKVPFHVKSDFYDIDGFLNGKNSLQDIELDILKDIQGKSILHLQCHFGQDSISLSRLGAHVTGVDFSEEAINYAKDLAVKVGTDTQFICANIYELDQYLDQKFDIVFTSYGVIGWLPDLDKWAKVISNRLLPGGQLIFVEFHPFIWMYDDNFENIKYSYFKSDPIIEIENGTYAEKSAEISGENITWNHSISEVINSLIQNGLKIQSLQEYDYSPYNCFEKTVEIDPNKYQIQDFGNKIPMVYSIVAVKE